jgi:hypothetical protein
MAIAHKTESVVINRRVDKPGVRIRRYSDPRARNPEGPGTPSK